MTRNLQEPSALILPLILIASCATAEAPSQPPGLWPPERIQAWYDKLPPIRGFNYLPRTAVNSTEMWQRETFDPKAIDEELGWAEKAGYNSARVFLQYIVFRDDPRGLEKRFGQFLEIASKHKIRVLPIFFCDCSFAGKEPYPGKQDDPVPGVHNSGWVPSPGLKLVTDRTSWPTLEAYVKGMVAPFAGDERILAWDLYNEPGNSSMGAKSLPLVEAAFEWARSARPSQPLTVGAWADFKDPMSRRLMELSDFISFHAYDAPEGVKAKIAACRALGRPIVCTEWLLRQGGNTFASILPIFSEERVGWYHWGLVAGRTQTYMHWGSQKGTPTPALWQHDVFHADGRPFDPKEIELVRKFVFPPHLATGDIWIRDPFIFTISATKTYIMIGTSGRRGFSAYASADLERWRGPIDAFTAPPDFWATRDFWAPEIHEHRGRYYLLASFKSETRRRGTQILASDRPEGPYAPHSPGPVTPEDWECLDGTLHADKEGKPWMVFCHEWVQVSDGTVCAVELASDLRNAAGKPELLFRASDAPWVSPLGEPGKLVTDGPFLHRTASGELLMLWSSFREGKYALGVARSRSGDVLGPWAQDPQPLFSDDGGHGMLFRTFEGKLLLALHAPNGGGKERVRFIPIVEEGGALRIPQK